MIVAYLKSNNLKSEVIHNDNLDLLSEAAWIDVFAPTKEEEIVLKQALDIAIPTREEMLEIEISNRLYKENDAIYMTANMLSKGDSLEPSSDAITLINAGDKLITIRYIEAGSFGLFISRLSKLSEKNYHAVNLTIELLDATIDRLADILERIGFSLDKYSQTIFRPQTSDATSHKIDYKKLLREIGSNGDLCTKSSESLITLNLLIIYFGGAALSALDMEFKSKIALLEKDILALSNHVYFLSNKVNFLLDATLGLVNIEQNDIIKIFSIAAVMFLPPTLIASIYGMNFHFIPELAWELGYPLAIIGMFLSAWLPYKFLKKRKWL
jgi:magnesium transporter